MHNKEILNKRAICFFPFANYDYTKVVFFTRRDIYFSLFHHSCTLTRNFNNDLGGRIFEIANTLGIILDVNENGINMMYERTIFVETFISGRSVADGRSF